MAKATLGALTPSHVIRKKCYSGFRLFLACLAVQLLFLYFLASWRLGGVFRFYLNLTDTAGFPGSPS